jgi:phosphoribosylaminoimidazolecarboxamide formyltransferase/IMP cyclohydrolase
MFKQNALISAYDKRGVPEFGDALVRLGWKLYASGGTAKVLEEAGLEVIDVASIVGPPILGHRVVTLSREILAGVLARDVPEDHEELERHKIPYFDLVYVNLYPLEDETRSPGATMESVIEKTDIGGPTLLRAAAKGRRIVISQDFMWREIISRLTIHGGDNPKLRHYLALQAEARVREYCGANVAYLNGYFEKLKPKFSL